MASQRKTGAQVGAQITNAQLQNAQLTVAAILEKSTALGIADSPYEEKELIAQNVEGTIETDGLNRKIFVVSDNTGTARTVIQPNSYVEGQTTYDLVMMEAVRELKTANITIEKGRRVRRAV